MKWRSEAYPSGTRVVISDDADLPHYGIGYPTWIEVGDSDQNRYMVAKALEIWLNGGAFPDCLRGAVPGGNPNVAEFSLILQNGMAIDARGPIKQERTTEYNSYEQAARIEIMEAIRLQRRPILQRVPNPEIGTGEET